MKLTKHEVQTLELEVLYLKSRIKILDDDGQDSGYPRFYVNLLTRILNEAEKPTSEGD